MTNHTPPHVIYTAEEAAAQGLPGADRICTHCGTYGAKYLRHLFQAGYGVVQLCPAHEDALATEMQRHQEAMRELTATNFKQDTIPASLKPAKPWQDSMHAREIRELAAAHGLDVRPRGKAYELLSPEGVWQFHVEFNSRNEFLYASTRDGVNFASDRRSHAGGSTPRQLLNMFREHVNKNYR